MSQYYSFSPALRILAFAACTTLCQVSFADTPTSLPGYQASLASVSTGSCLDITGSSALSGLAIAQAGCGNPVEQLFAFLPQSDGTYTIHPPESPNLCVDLNDSGRVVQNYCLPTASQKWSQTLNSDGSHLLTNSQNSQCLVVSPASGKVPAGFATAKCDSSVLLQKFSPGPYQPYTPPVISSTRALPALPVPSPTAGVWQPGMFNGMPYRVLFPVGYDPAQHLYPLVLFLHGAGERGTDNIAYLQTDLAALAKDLDFRAKAPLIIVAPQCPVNDDWGNAWNSSPSTSEALAVQLTQTLASSLAVDPTRVSVTGLSMGGMGAWDIINRYAKTFAAAAPVAGAGNLADIPNLVKVPILAVHGQIDTVVAAYFDEAMYAGIHALGGPMLYFEIAWYPHDVWDVVYPMTSFWQWMYTQKHI